MSRFTPIVKSEEGINLFVWDPTKECDPDKCPMAARCKVLAWRKPEGGYSSDCLWEQKYLGATAWLVIDDELGIGDQLNDAEKSTLASQATMLAYQMILFMKQIQGMNDDEMFPVDRQGKLHEHPVFGAMRSTLTQYNKLMKEYKVNELWAKKFGDPKYPEPVKDARDFFEKGDPNHHSRLMESGTKPSRVGYEDGSKYSADGVHWKTDVRKERKGGQKYVRKTIPKPGEIDKRPTARKRTPAPPTDSGVGRGKRVKGQGKSGVPESKATPDF